MPRKSDTTKTYCTLREAFDRVGTEVFGPKWRGFEVDCNPAQATQPTDAKTLLRKLAPDGQSFSTKEKDRQPVPKRPIDGKDGAKLERAIGRHTKALKEILRLTHNGLVPTEFIPENETTAREIINPSAWPDPAEFNPENPDYGDLWFDIAAGRVVLKSPGASPIPGRAQGDGSLWWAYGGRAGHVEIDREALEKALRPPEGWEVDQAALPVHLSESNKQSLPIPKKGGRPRVYDWDAFHREVARLANLPDGLPETQAELERQMAEWCLGVWSAEPSETMIKEKVRLIFQQLTTG